MGNDFHLVHIKRRNLISSFSIIIIKENFDKLAVTSYKVIQMAVLTIITNFAGTCMYKVKLLAFLKKTLMVEW